MTSLTFSEDFVEKFEKIADSVKFMVEESKNYNYYDLRDTNSKMSKCEYIKDYIELN